MGSIVCATRGGEGSRAAQEAAIRYAQDKQQELIFIYVVDFDTLDEFDDSLLPSVRQELTWLGQSLLRIARRRAEQAGVTAQIIILEGEVQRVIEEFLQETHAEVLVLGAPRGTTANVFGDDAIEQFAQTIEKDTRVRTEIARPEKVMSESGSQ